MTRSATPLRGPAAAHSMPFGAQLAPGGGVDFRLWAPAAQQAEVLWGAGGGADAGTPASALARAPAAREAGGWWRVHVPAASADTHYQWQVNGSLQVPDPAARHAPHGPHNLCVVTDPGRYTWHREDWPGRPWHEQVFYELHVGTFTPAGTYAAAAAQLPRLADLGFTAIELMPLATFGGQWGWGYDGVLPFAPHSAYGSPHDLKRFIDAAHTLGLCVFLDVVYNHFGPDGNYLHAYAPAVFSSTHQSPWGAAINFDGEGSETVREFFVHNALYWVEEFRFDGLRLDAVHAIVDDSRPHILDAISASVRALASATGRQIHLVLENEKNQTGWLLAPTGGQAQARYDGQWNDDFHHALHVALTGEAHTYYGKFADDPMGHLARTLTHGFAFPDGAVPTSGNTPVALAAMVNFLGNHDQVGNRAFGERLAAVVPEPAAELALLLVLLTPATPMVFMGDEFGATTPFLYFANWDGELRDAVRAGRQKEFSHAVPDDDTLPDPCDAATWAASRLDWVQCELPAGRARSSLLQRALEIRRAAITPHAPRLRTGVHTAQRVGARGLRVVWHYSDGRQWCLDANLGPEVLTDALPDPHGAAVWQHRWADATTPGSPAGWAPWSARWTCLEAHA